MGSHKNKIDKSIELCEKVKAIIPAFDSRMDFVIKVLKEKRFIKNARKR